MHGEVPAFLTLFVARETLDGAGVVPRLYIYDPLGIPLLIDVEHEKVAEEDHGRLDAVTGTNLGKAGEDPMAIG